VILSWDIRLAALRVSSGLLISFMNLLEGVAARGLVGFEHLPSLSELRQASDHAFFLIFASWYCLAADGLISNGRLRYEGSRDFLDCSPSAAFFASWSDG